MANRCDICGEKVTLGQRFSPVLIFPICQYHSSNAPHSSSPPRHSYHQDKSAKPGKLQKTSALLGSRQQWTKISFPKSLKRSQLASVCVSQYTDCALSVAGRRSAHQVPCPSERSVAPIISFSLISTKKRVRLSPYFSDRRTTEFQERLLCSNMQTHRAADKPELPTTGRSEGCRWLTDTAVPF